MIPRLVEVSWTLTTVSQHYAVMEVLCHPDHSMPSSQRVTEQMMALHEGLNPPRPVSTRRVTGCMRALDYAGYDEDGNRTDAHRPPWWPY